MKVDISKTYNPKEAESRWYPWWESQGYFRADATSKRLTDAVVEAAEVLTPAQRADLAARFQRRRGG